MDRQDVAGCRDPASCDGGFKGQTIRVVTTLGPSDDLWWWWVRSTRPGEQVRGDQAEERGGDTPRNYGLWLVMIMTRLTMQWLSQSPVKQTHDGSHSVPGAAGETEERCVVTRSVTPGEGSGNIGIMRAMPAWLSNQCLIHVHKLIFHYP